MFCSPCGVCVALSHYLAVARRRGFFSTDKHQETVWLTRARERSRPKPLPPSPARLPATAQALLKLQSPDGRWVPSRELEAILGVPLPKEAVGPRGAAEEVSATALDPSPAAWPTSLFADAGDEAAHAHKESLASEKATAAWSSFGAAVVPAPPAGVGARGWRWATALALAALRRYPAHIDDDGGVLITATTAAMDWVPSKRVLEAAARALPPLQDELPRNVAARLDVAAVAAGRYNDAARALFADKGLKGFTTRPTRDEAARGEARSRTELGTEELARVLRSVRDPEGNQSRATSAKSRGVASDAGDSDGEKPIISEHAKAMAEARRASRASLRSAVEAAQPKGVVALRQGLQNELSFEAAAALPKGARRPLPRAPNLQELASPAVRSQAKHLRRPRESQAKGVKQGRAIGSESSKPRKPKSAAEVDEYVPPLPADEQRKYDRARRAKARARRREIASVAAHGGGMEAWWRRHRRGREQPWRVGELVAVNWRKTSRLGAAFARDRLWLARVERESEGARDAVASGAETRVDVRFLSPPEGTLPGEEVEGEVERNVLRRYIVRSADVLADHLPRKVREWVPRGLVMGVAPRVVLDDAVAARAARKDARRKQRRSERLMRPLSTERAQRPAPNTSAGRSSSGGRTGSRELGARQPGDSPQRPPRREEAAGDFADASNNGRNSEGGDAPPSDLRPLSRSTRRSRGRPRTITDISTTAQSPQAAPDPAQIWFYEDKDDDSGGSDPEGAARFDQTLNALVEVAAQRGAYAKRAELLSHRWAAPDADRVPVPDLAAAAEHAMSLGGTESAESIIERARAADDAAKHSVLAAVTPVAAERRALATEEHAAATARPQWTSRHALPKSRAELAAGDLASRFHPGRSPRSRARGRRRRNGKAKPTAQQRVLQAMQGAPGGPKYSSLDKAGDAVVVDAMARLDMAVSSARDAVAAGSAVYARASTLQQQQQAFDGATAALLKAGDAALHAVETVRAWERRQESGYVSAKKAAEQQAAIAAAQEGAGYGSSEEEAAVWHLQKRPDPDLYVAFMWQGVPAISYIARCLDWASESPQLREWYADQYPWRRNPFAASAPIDARPPTPCKTHSMVLVDGSLVEQVTPALVRRNEEESSVLRAAWTATLEVPSWWPAAPQSRRRWRRCRRAEQEVLWAEEAIAEQARRAVCGRPPPSSKR